MINTIETNKLKEHHKNGYYFTDIEGEKYEEMKRSIETYGIRDPIKCTRDYTVISGHQRLRIARDLGLEKVPYQMLDVDEKTAEYLLIAENVERRGQAETDPIKKSRIANFLKEYWDIGHGGKRSSGQNGHLKTTADIADTIGESEKNARRILKLHDLIPQLQTLISGGKLGTTAGEQLAYLSPEVQTALYETLGDEIAKKTVKETKELRREVQDKTPEEVVEVIKQENEMLRKENESLRKINEINERRAKEGDKLKEELERLGTTKDDYGRAINAATELSGLVVKIEHLLKDELAPIKYSRAMTEQRDNEIVQRNLEEIVGIVRAWCDEMDSYLNKNNYIDVEVITYE